MTVHPWVAQALAAREGPFTPSRSVHRSLAARTLTRTIAHNRLRNPDAHTLPAGGIAYHPHRYGHLVPPHGVFATPTSQLLVFSDRTALVLDHRGRLVPFVWRVGGTPPQVDGLAAGTVLCCSFGDRDSKPGLILANAERPKARSWAIAVPHAQLRFSDSYAPVARDVSDRLMAHVDALAALNRNAPAIAHTVGGAPAGAWTAPFQALGASPSQGLRTRTMAAFAAVLHLVGAVRGVLSSARLAVDGSLDWDGTWAAQPTAGQGAIRTEAISRQATALLDRLLPVYGIAPMDLVWQTNRSHGTGLETTVLLETDARRPESRHIELALHHALAQRTA